MYKVPVTMLMRPRPLLRALSPTPPDPNPWIDTRSAAEFFVDAPGFAGLLAVWCKVFAALIPEISSKVVGGVRVPCALTEAERGSSVDSGPPELDGSTGMDARCVSFWAFPTGDSGLLVLGT